jgi:hypothetical protein
MILGAVVVWAFRDSRMRFSNNHGLAKANFIKKRPFSTYIQNGNQ